MLNLWIKVRAFTKFLQSRTFLISMLSVVCAFVVFQITSRTNTIYITDQQERSIQFTVQNQAQPILQRVGLGTLSEQEVQFAGISGHFAQLNTTQQLNVTIQADGEQTTLTAPKGTTVGDLLHAQGIQYDGNDLLSPSAEKPLDQDETIVLKRVEYERFTEDKPIPYETVHKNSSLIRVGTTKTIQAGEDGILTLTYVQRTVDGEKEDIQLLGEHVTKSPVTETILIGSVAPVSPLDFDLNVDEHGKPLNYAKVLTDQVATAYSARRGAKTASGRYAIPGHVAVDPKEIPYGTKLYIVSKDNRFVYGCAIAADTGTGLMADIIDVDLFYETYQESVLHGRKAVDIYILE